MLRTMKIVSQYNVNVILCTVLFCVVLLFSACDYVPQQSPSLAVNSASPLVSVDRGGFDQVIARKAGKVVLVDFWADWCGPCKMIAPILDEIATEYGDRLKICKLDIDENQETPPKYGIRGIPTLMLFKDGEVSATKVGALSKSQLAAFLDSNI